jgi:hypothetical protein
MCFKREGCLVTLCHEKGRLSLGINYDSTTQFCLRKRPFSSSDLFKLLISSEKSGLAPARQACETFDEEAHGIQTNVYGVQLQEFSVCVSLNACGSMSGHRGGLHGVILAAHK